VSRVAVVGAGVGGLAVAARLAALGHAVSVYERAETVGGKLGRYERTTPHGTFRFDTGPSLLTLPHVFTDLAAATGGPLCLDPVELDPIVRHVFPDGTTLDSSRDPDWGDDWRRLWRRAERVWTASCRDVLRRPVDSPLALARLAWRLGDLAAVAPGRTLRGLGRTYLRDPRLRMLLDRYATYAGADPRRAPAALVAIPYAELAFGGWYLRGGLATLADALLGRCLDLGVAVHTGTAVTGIDAAGGAVHGVRLGGSVGVSAEVVVSDVDAQALYRDLLPTPRRLARLADRSLGGFVMLLGVRGRTPGLAHHTVFFPPDYDAEFDAIFGDPGRGVPARPAADPAVFVTVADDPAVRPGGYESWFVLVNAPPPSRVDWARQGLADAYADMVLAVLADRGLDARDRLVFREIRAPEEPIYGTAGHTLLRPPNRGPVRGLFLVGGSTHPGGGLPMVALSAEIVAGRIGPPR
jgi:phytoene desaturase